MPTPEGQIGPYARSGLNRLLDAIGRLPYGGWWVYPLTFIGLASYHELALWATGGVPLGTLSLEGIPGIAYGPYGLAALAAFTRVAGTAMDAFRPASGLSDEAFATRRYELVTIPSGRLAIPLLVGAIVGVGSVLSASPAGLAPYGGTPSIAFIVLGPAALFGYGITGVGLYVSLRALRLVHDLHMKATAIDPFDTGPIYAFSRLTQVTAIAYVVVGYYAFLVNGAFQAGNAVGLGVIAGTVSTGVACFVVPLWGIHGRLTEAKAGLVREGSLRAKSLQDELYRRVDGGNLAGVKDLTDALGGIRTVTERVDKLPTWPWPPQVLRGFISAILLPVVVFLITRYVGTQIT